MKSKIEELHENDLDRKNACLTIARGLKDAGFKCPVCSPACKLWDGECPFAYRPPEGPESTSLFAS